jgi:hypothetical protein
MTLTQKKALSPTFIFTVNGKKLKITRKGLTSRRSYEISLGDLDPHRLEESNFSIPWLVATIIFSSATVLMWFWALTLSVNDEEVVMLWIFSFLPLVLTLFSVYRFRSYTYNLLHLCRSSDGAPIVTFYNHQPDNIEMLEFIDSLYSQSETNSAGFLNH